MDINRGNMTALFQTLLTAWQAELEARMTELQEVQQFATQFPSNSASNLYAWLDRVPGFREWVGDRVYNNVKSKKFEVVNKDFEDSVRIDANDLADDQYGLYAPLVRMLAAGWPELQRAQMVEVFTSNPLTFTGKAFFADDHAYGGNTIDNMVTTSLSTVAFEAALLAASAWKFSDNTLVKPRFTHLVVGEANRSTAWNIVKNTKVASGDAGSTVDNPNQGRCELVLWPELTGSYAYYWFLVDASRPVKPIALQIRKVPQPMMDTDAARIEANGYVDFLASGRLAAAPTFPHLVYGGLATS
jgi:phage major head subunit gpT-like protein